MRNKSISYAIICVVVFCGLFAFMNFQLENAVAPPITIYVDDDNVAGPWDGSLTNPYRWIQDGVDAAADGDTVFVFNGTYKYVIINKTISLIGEDKSNTSMDGGADDVVYISSDWVNVTGFTISKCGSGTWNAGVLLENVNNCRITDNNISFNDRYGILLNYSNDNYIADNIVSFNQYRGINLEASSFNTITKNNIIENTNWAVVLESESTDNEIIHNLLLDNHNYAIYARSFSNNTIIMHNDVISNDNYGIYVRESTNCQVSHNNVTSNDNYGMYFPDSPFTQITNNNISFNQNYGMYLYNSNNCTVANNEIYSNKNHGIRISESPNTTVSNNEIKGNGWCGIHIRDTTYNEIIDNNITFNNESGVYLYSFITYSHNNTFTGNNISSNLNYGIYSEEGIFNTFQNNEVMNNNWTGIYLYSLSNDNTVEDNDISSNGNEGIYLESSSFNQIIDNNVDYHDYGIRFSDSHNNVMLLNNIGNHTFGFFLDYSNNNQIGYNTVIDTSISNFGSCPVLYTWDGEDMKFFGDINGPGGLGYTFDMGIYGGGIERRAPTATDYTALDSSILVPNSGYYELEVAEDQDEITYFDEVKLWVVDHEPGVEIYSPEAALATQTPYLHAPVIHTVRNPMPPISATDWHGKDVLSVIESPDNLYTEAELLTDNYITLDFGDLSGVSQIKMVYRAYSDWAPIGKVKENQYVEVKNAQGEWELVSPIEHFGKPEALPRTYVIDITEWFKTDDWHVRLHTGSVKIHVDWIAVDTTVDEPVDVTILEPVYADHYEKEIIHGFEYFFGNFTGYGHVLPLLKETDDKYVIMRPGDSVKLKFSEVPDSGKERDFILFTDAFFKQPFVKYLLGNEQSTVDPLPFHGMSNYPYPSSESYPYDPDHLQYISDWNTRLYEGDEGAGMSLPSSNNNTVIGNTIIGDSGSTGLLLVWETNATLIDNVITQTWRGISLHESNKITIKNNQIFDVSEHGIFLYDSTNSTVSNNEMDGCGIQIEGGAIDKWNSHEIDINNTVNGKPVYYWKNMTQGAVLQDAGEVILANCTNISISNLETVDGSVGISLGFSWLNNITQNNVSNNFYGIYLRSSSNNTILKNEASQNDNRGIYLHYSHDNEIAYNNVSNNGDRGIFLIFSSRNRVFRNNIINNNFQAYDNMDDNLWNETYPTGGNYWSDWTSPDLMRGPAQSVAGSDGIVDNQYDIDGDSTDYYPFIGPVELVPPEIFNLHPPDGNSTSDDTPTISASITDSSLILEHEILLLVDGVNRTGDAAITQSDIMYVPVMILSDGPHTVYLEVMDACGNTNNKTWSFEVDNTSPGVIFNLVAGDPSFYSISLTWTSQGDDGGAGKAQGYEVRYNRSGPVNDSNWASSLIYEQDWMPLSGGNIESYVVDGLQPYTQYWFAIKAYDDAGNYGTISNSPNETTTGPVVPSPPENLKAQPGDLYVNLSWDYPSSDGGTPVTNYIVYKGESPGTLIFLDEIENVHDYNDTDVTNGVAYYYSVSAKNMMGEGPQSDDVQATPFEKPGMPDNISAESGDCFVNLTWEAPYWDGGSPITNYTIYRSHASGPKSLITEVGNVRYYNDTFVENGVKYYYEVGAKNAAGEGPLIGNLSATPKGPPDAPENLQVQAGDGYVLISWNAPSDDGGSEITNYVIYRATVSGNETSLAEIGNLFSFNDTEVTNGVNYYYQIRAKNTVGLGSFSDEISAIPIKSANQLPTVTVTPLPSGEKLKGIVQLTGSADDSDGTVVHLEIKFDDGGWTIIDVTYDNETSNWSYDLDTTVLSNGEHSVYIRAYDGEYYSDESSFTIDVANPVPKEEKSIVEEAWFWGLVVLIVIIIVTLLFLKGKKKKSAEEEIDKALSEEEESSEGDDKEDILDEDLAPSEKEPFEEEGLFRDKEILED